MRPVEVDDLKFLRAHTDRKVKITVPGPFTMLQQAQNDFYASEDEAAMDYAAAVNEEIQDLFAAGADVVQIDEPYMQARPEKARQYGLQALNRALEGVHRHDRGAHLLRLRGDHPRAAERLLVPARAGPVQLPPGLDRDRAVAASTARRCWPLDGKQIMVGCIDLSDPKVETPETIVARIERALPYVEAENVILAPDCGMKYLPRETAIGKLQAMVAAAKILRARHG